MPCTFARLRVEVAHHVAGVRSPARGCSARHDRLQQHRVRLQRALLQRLRARELERHLRRVDRVLLAVEQRHLAGRPSGSAPARPRAAPRRRPSRRPGCSSAAPTPPTTASTNSKPLPLFGSTLMCDARVLAVAARLLLVDVLRARRFRVTVSRYGTRGGCRSTSTPNLRFIRSAATSTCVSPMPGDHHLARRVVAVDVQRRILLGDAVQRRPHLLDVALPLRRHGDVVRRLRELRAAAA